MDWFTALDPQQQNTIIGGFLGVVGTIVVAILGGAGWAIGYLIRAGARKKDLRRIKMQHIMERLIQIYDWMESNPNKASHPADHILWLCEVYGGSTALNDAAEQLVRVCNNLAEVSSQPGANMSIDVLQQIDDAKSQVRKVHRSTRRETLRILRDLSGVKTRSETIARSATH